MSYTYPLGKEKWTKLPLLTAYQPKKLIPNIPPGTHKAKYTIPVLTSFHIPSKYEYVPYYNILISSFLSSSKWNLSLYITAKALFS